MLSLKEVNAIIRQLCSGLEPLFPQGSMEAIFFGLYARGEARIAVVVTNRPRGVMPERFEGRTMLRIAIRHC